MEIVIPEEAVESQAAQQSQLNTEATPETPFEPDERLIRVLVKIRDARAKLAKEYKEADGNLTAQSSKIEAELKRRLHARGATQTKTAAGTAFFGEDMKVTIGDDNAFRQFVIATADLDFYQKRVKVEHLREWMAEHDGRLPPGLNVFRELTINVRAPSKPRTQGRAAPAAYEEPQTGAEQ